MDERKEKNVEDNPTDTKEDLDTPDTLDPGNSESDETGVIHPAVHAEENGTAVVPNGKKDINQEVPKPSAETQEDSDLSEKTENTDASDFEVLTGDESSSAVPGITQGEQSGMVPSAKYGVEQRSDSLKEEANEDEEPKTEIQVTDHDNGASQREEGEQLSDANDNTSDTTEVSQTIQPDSSGEVQMSNDQTPAATVTNTPIITSEKKVGPNTDASRSEGTSNSGDNPALTSENNESGSDNLQSESRPSHAGHGGGKVVEEEKMKTGSGENKDDPKEGSQKEEQAKEEGVKGEGGTEDAVKTEERVVKERPVSISLCTSAYRFNVEGLISYLKDLMEDHPELIKEVKVHDLPYNDLDHYRFDEKDPVDVMILCHSINNRRFAITDVMDALYDEYLPYCARVIGKEKMGVIVHDFDDMRETVQSSRMSSFKYKQPKAFQTTSLQITCGHIEKEGQVLKQMRKADRDKIVGFLERASKYPEEMQKEETKWTESLKRFIPNFSDIKSYVGFGSSGGANESNIPTPKPEQKNDGTSVDPQPESTVGGDSKPDPPRGTSPVTQQIPGAVHATAASGTEGAIDLPSQQNMTQISGGVFASASSYATPRRISVSVCSSAYKRNVKGLLSWFAKFQAEQSHMITDVRFRQLPYNDIDSFKFPPNDPVDVMVLCHSVDNRGFSITNVENAIYEKYLKYCNKLIGKKKLAVIVHDFADCKPAILESRMESFRRMQKLTFELVDTVIICGSLEESDKLGIRKDDETRLIHFLEFARFEQKENLKQSLLGKLF